MAAGIKALDRAEQPRRQAEPGENLKKVVMRNGREGRLKIQEDHSSLIAQKFARTELQVDFNNIGQDMTVK